MIMIAPCAAVGTHERTELVLAALHVALPYAKSHSSFGPTRNTPRSQPDYAACICSRFGAGSPTLRAPRKPLGTGVVRNYSRGLCFRTAFIERSRARAHPRDGILMMQASQDRFREYEHTRRQSMSGFGLRDYRSSRRRIGYARLTCYAVYRGCNVRPTISK